ncbi:thiol-disulfide isomerase/thioredoxin [Chitinophagaceae bacterium OAS944]|nr:thiol-disulfide isomerase/thioredoxin [Chitinophagaceae bacterium OAS944]
MSLEELRGKWIILDFWNELCAACINSFPEVQSIHDKYSDDVKIISVAFNGTMGHSHSSEKSIKRMFGKLKSKYDFTFTIAYDSILYRIFNVPCIIIVDPIGCVRFITTSIDAKDIPHIIKQDFSKLTLFEGLKNVGKSPDINRLLFSDSNQMYFKSFSHWVKGYAITPLYLLKDTTLIDSFEMNGFTLADFYRLAYTGILDWDNGRDPYYSSFSYYPLLRMKDSSFFDENKKYCFLLKLPKRVSFKVILELLRNSLNETFGYKVATEKLLQPYWSVSLIDSSFKEKLNTKGGPMINLGKGKYQGFEYKNVPVSFLTTALWSNYSLRNRKQIGRPPGPGRPFIDETGLGNIDLSIDAYTADFKEFRKALLEKGIVIREKLKYMNSLIIEE